MKREKQPELQFIFHDPNPEETAKNFEKIMMEVKLKKARKIIFENYDYDEINFKKDEIVL